MAFIDRKVERRQENRERARGSDMQEMVILICIINHEVSCMQLDYLVRISNLISTWLGLLCIVFLTLLYPKCADLIFFFFFFCLIFFL